VTGALVEAGILEENDGRVSCPFRISPYLGLWILADEILHEPASVMPTGPATEKLADFLGERLEGSMLDVGCGPGSLALLAAHRGARRVLGTDINERAIAMARFNARLNQLSAEFRIGDLVAPAQGQRFDLIVSQPPFILRSDDTPDIAFLHGGARGDELLHRLLHSLAGVLTRRGEAIVLSDVPLRKDEDMHAYVRNVIGATGVDLLALHAPALSPEMRGLIYAGFESPDPGEGYLTAVCRHISQFERLGIVEIRHTLFVARRPVEGASRLRATPMPIRDSPAVGPGIRTRLWESVAVADLDDEALCGRRIRVAPDAEWFSRRSEPEGDFTEHRVRFGDLWPAQEQVVPEAGVALATLLERAERVADALAAYAELCEATVEEVRTPVLRYMREGLMTGMLVSEEKP
jgi:predicted RNA methylase